MRADWEALHTSLVRSIRNLRSDQEFSRLRQIHEPLRRYPDPGALVAHMASGNGDLDAKDAALACLVQLVQEGEARELALALLWLSLWPGLDVVYRRRLRHFLGLARLDGVPAPAAPREFVSVVFDSFTSLVKHLDLREVSRVASSLVRGTDRDVLAWLRKEWRSRASSAGGDGQEPRTDAARGSHESELGLPPGMGFDEAVQTLHGWLLPITGDDTDLVLAVILLEETQREAGQRLGLSADAARKRFQRALGVIRTRLGDRLSHSALRTRVCSSAGPARPGGEK
jgi:DNA-directed RNA polymerase specialized sigma24 family protein